MEQHRFGAVNGAKTTDFVVLTGDGIRI